MKQEISLGRFAFVLIAAGVTVFVALTAIDVIFKFDLSSSFTAFIAPLYASMDAGQQFFKKHGNVPEKNTAWRLSLKMTVVEFFVALPFSIVFAFIISKSTLEISLNSIIWTFVILTIVYTLISWIVKRFFFSIAAKNLQKRELKTKSS